MIQTVLNVCRVAVCAGLLGAAITMRTIHAQTTPITLERIAILETEEKNLTTRLGIIQEKIDLTTSKQDSMLGWGAGAFSVLTIITTVQLLLTRRKNA